MAEPASEDVAGAAPRQLTLRISETDRPAEDQRLLDDVKRLLLEHRGEDSVNLEIARDGRVVTLEWPLVRARICPELEQGLQQILGSSGHVLVEGGLQ